MISSLFHSFSYIWLFLASCSSGLHSASPSSFPCTRNLFALYPYKVSQLQGPLQLPNREGTWVVTKWVKPSSHRIQLGERVLLRVTHKVRKSQTFLCQTTLPMPLILGWSLLSVFIREYEDIHQIEPSCYTHSSANNCGPHPTSEALIDSSPSEV